MLTSQYSKGRRSQTWDRADLARTHRPQLSRVKRVIRQECQRRVVGRMFGLSGCSHSTREPELKYTAFDLTCSIDRLTTPRIRLASTEKLAFSLCISRSPL